MIFFSVFGHWRKQIKKKISVTQPSGLESTCHDQTFEVDLNHSVYHISLPPILISENRIGVSRWIYVHSLLVLNFDWFSSCTSKHDWRNVYIVFKSNLHDYSILNKSISVVRLGFFLGRMNWLAIKVPFDIELTLL